MDRLGSFAQYAFKNHTLPRMLFVAYQTVYLKAHYPSEFMAVALNSAGSLKNYLFMEERKSMGIKVLGQTLMNLKKDLQ